MINRKQKQAVLAIVVPCYNEELVINETANQLIQIQKKLSDNLLISQNSFICFIDDGSKDQTWNIISRLSVQKNSVKGIKLAHNSGHQNALLAGLLTVRKYADCIISIDADLQDDVTVIEKFVEEYYNGFDIVYGIRKQRKTDSFFKKFSALFFYRLMLWMGVEIVNNHADYRLTSKRVLDSLENYNEVNLFLRGIFPIIGFKSTIISYNRGKRFAGESKYPLRKMLSFALDGITSFSVRPLRMVTTVGFLIFILSLIMGIYVIFEAKVLNKTISGWASTVLPIYLLGGIQILSLGVIGEYIGKIYKETKNRPRYIIEEEL